MLNVGDSVLYYSEKFTVVKKYGKSAFMITNESGSDIVHENCLKQIDANHSLTVKNKTNKFSKARKKRNHVYPCRYRNPEGISG